MEEKRNCVLEVYPLNSCLKKKKKKSKQYLNVFLQYQSETGYVLLDKVKLKEGMGQMIQWAVLVSRNESSVLV